MVAAVLLLLLLPLIVVIAVAVAWSTRGGVVYRQPRVGRDGVVFTLLKFRTMHVGTTTPGSLTVGADDRITRVGRWLRGSKLDELPQLVNVLMGDMALVGPRPEVPEHVVRSPEQDLLLHFRPGLTDPASLAFHRREAQLLAAAADPVKLYRGEVLPAKLRLSAEYARSRSGWSDVRVLLRTGLHLVGRGG
jgi:lipopolysaccharide/colanic/teichoic acid biosynthesis glycosyltransferase